MASSNRHWPSMFRSNPGCNQPDMNNSSSSSSSSSSLISGTKPPFSSGCEDRSPEPKPRWNPKPEQIRILEAIFNSGMVNPPRDEIRRIRLQLQQYGQVGDANVFYWFQNRKSRSKNKLRAAGQSGRAALARACAASAAAAPPMTPPPLLVASVAPTSSSSSSSDRSSGSSKPVRPAAPMATGFLPAAAIDLLSPLYYNSQLMAPPPAPEFTVPEPLVLQWPQSHYFSAAELAGIVATQAQAPIQPSAPGVFLGLGNELLGHANGLSHYWCGGGDPDLSKSTDAMNTVTKEEETAKLGLLQYAFGGTAANAPAAVTTLPPAASIDAATVAAATVTTAPGLPNASASSVATSLVTDQLQGVMDVGVLGGAAPMATVTVARHAVVCTSTTQYSVPAMHLNVRLFGDAAVLFRDTGEPVLVDKSGVTVEPLEQGAVYYVLVD